MANPGMPHDLRAEELFRAYRSRLEAGDRVDFEALCEAHSEHAQELRRLRDAFELVDRVRPTVQGASLAQRLKEKYGPDADPNVTLDEEPHSEGSPSSKLFERLQAEGPRGSRYRLLGEVARGGMGAILKIWDAELRRTLAMKVVLGRDLNSTGDTTAVDPRTLGRFLEEAQITGQLDHPGIVPVHELGLDATGQVYFTMKLVKGEDLRAVFLKVRTGVDGWSQIRALNVLLRVCEALSFAHSKAVVHRDLKPANVMVGKFGEVYVMDWGLARVQGRADRHDVRLRPEWASTRSVVKTERHEETPDSPLVTMDGDVVGTPSYMPPEQARGELEKLGPHSDVYSIGAMLYQLVSGRMPYVPPDARMSAHTILAALLHGPPEPVESIAPETPPELVAIIEKAMAREIALRYHDTQELAADLRAYVEGRVVAAYETGAWAETRNWVKRNRVLAGTIAASILLLLGGLTTSLVFKAQADQRASDLQLANTTIQQQLSALEAATSEAQAEAVRATRESTKAVAMRDFLKNMLSAVTLRNGVVKTMDVRVRDVLDPAAELLKSDTTTDVDVRAALHTTLAQSYGALTMLEEAEREYRTALVLMDEKGRDQTFEAGEVSYALAETMLTAPELTKEREREADALYTRARSTLERLPGDHRVLIDAIEGSRLYLRARHGDVERWPAYILPYLGTFLGETDPAKIRARLDDAVDSASRYWRGGRKLEAKRILLGTIATRLDEPGLRAAASGFYSRVADEVSKEHWWTLVEPLRELVLDLELGRSPPDVASLCSAKGLLARYYMDVRRWDDAKRVLEEAVPEALDGMGIRPSVTRNLMATLARNYLRMGLADEARALALDLVNRTAQDLGASDRGTLDARMTLAEICIELGDHTLAAEQLSRFLGASPRPSKKDRHALGRAFVLHGLCLLHTGDAELARAELQFGWTSACELGPQATDRALALGARAVAECFDPLSPERALACRTFAEESERLRAALESDPGH